MHHTGRTLNACFLAAAVGLASVAHAQLRVATWNVSNYSGGRIAEFQTSIYGQYQGRSMAPDILIGQEFINAAAVASFLSILNNAPGSPGDWSAAPFSNGNDSDNAFFYRTGRVQYVGQTLVSQGSSSPTHHPRDVVRYDVRPMGYTGAAATLACYSSHMKAGAGTADQQQRLVEAAAIRANAASLPPAWNFLLAGDFNIQASTQAAYQELVGEPASGRFNDPINTPGNWNNTSGFRFVHTQAPGGTDPQVTGGMDDRLDFILLSTNLIDTQGFAYIGNPALPYSTGTWNDPNHSYRVWGNDGSSFNLTLNTASNAMVGPAIASALNASPGNEGGHLPVYLDLRVPAKIGAPAVIDFGTVPQGAPAQRSLLVSNAGEVGRWTVGGISALRYSMSPTSGLTAPPGAFTAAAGSAGNSHVITLSSVSLGPFNGSITINSDDPDEPARIVVVTGEVVAPCYANCDGSTIPPVLNVNDFICFQIKFAAGDPAANCDGSTIPPALNVNDFICFQTQFAAGCP